MSQRDPFEDYRRRREIELMESQFREKAAEKRQRIEDLLAHEEGEPAEIEEKVNQEMEDFLSESTRTAERMLGDFREVDDSAEVRSQRREKVREEVRTFFGEQGAEGAGTEPDPHRVAASEPGPRADPPAGEPAARSRPAEAVRPSVTPRRPLGGKQGGGSNSLDLRAALDKIRRHSGPEEPGAPAPGRDPSGGSSGSHGVLDDFDRTYQEVSDLLQRGMEETGGAEPGSEGPSDRESFDEPAAGSPADAAALYRERIRKSASDLSEGGGPSIRPTPPEGGGEESGAAPPGVTNVFSSEPDEDRDLDDDVSGDDPPGWDIPVRPPPPGAWIVKKQKEEGDSGLAGASGDTYLLKKLSQEVRRLNRLYVVLLEKKVVTREEVEGGAEAGAAPADAKPVRKPAPAAADDEDDDDVVTIDDYDEDRYRPILTSEKDFSLSTLVQDVHRLKCLREVLVKKGVVTEKELEKRAK